MTPFFFLFPLYLNVDITKMFYFSLICWESLVMT